MATGADKEQVKLHRVDNEHVAFHCPGCDRVHVIPISGEKAWSWNQSLDAPTFQPSIKVTVPWHGEIPRVTICHSVVTDGKIAFATDSTHFFSGLITSIPDWTEEGGSSDGESSANQ